MQRQDSKQTNKTSHLTSSLKHYSIFCKLS